jgi:hypothetical protein
MNSAFLLKGERTSSALMIPGAYERRASASGGSDGYDTGMQVKAHMYAVTVSARERLVYEREGGGAPSERSGERPASILQKLWLNMRRRNSRQKNIKRGGEQ